MINRAINIFNRDYSHQNKKCKLVAQNNSIVHDITSIARCKCQQNVLTTKIKIKTSNYKYLRISVLKTVKKSQRYTSRFTNNNTQQAVASLFSVCVVV